VVIVAAVGQTILTTAGMLSGWITSIVSASAPLIGQADQSGRRSAPGVAHPV
jgi:hypothetical protein